MTKRTLSRLGVPAGAVIVGLVAVVVLRSGDDGATPRRAGSAASAVRVRDLVTRTDLRPPAVSIRRSKPGQAPGLIFVAPKKVFGAKPVAGAQGGAEIIDSRGRVRYFRPNRGGKVANDLRVQRYQGKPVLTYWYGRQIQGAGKGYGVILDEHYRRIATVHAGNGLQADFHELTLTPDGTALITAFHDTTAKGKKVVEGVIQEIDVESGKVLTEWHSLDDVPVSESYEPRGSRSASAFDYFHVNGADLDTDGNILVSARHTWAIYKVERHTGRLLWTLGGKASDFEMAGGAQTAWQHDVRSIAPNVITVFDNAAGDSGARKLHGSSRVTTIRIDPTTKTATLVKAQTHPSGLSAGTQGNGQLLPDGHLFVGWGSQGVVSEFDEKGAMLFDARVPRGNDTYRAYRSPWTGTPTGAPSVDARVRGARVVVHASWNGSTQVQAWRVLTGASKGALRPAGRTAWKDLETGWTVADDGARYAAVQALDGSGNVLATSRVRTIER